MQFLAHRLKSKRIENATITVRLLPNEPLRLCFMRVESSLDPDVTCDVQMSKNALSETCSVLEPRGADALCLETMKAWHHLWHSLKCDASSYLTLKYACAKRQKRWKYDPQASRNHSKQFGKGTTSSPLNKYDFVTPSQSQRFSATPIGNRGSEHSCGLFTDTIPLRTARERMQSAACHCHKH